jgi:glycosyltransferase involved in cell wall biosynthesis
MKLLILPHTFGDEISPTGGIFHVEQASALKKRGIAVTVAYLWFRPFRTWPKGKWLKYMATTVRGERMGIPFTEIRFWSPFFESIRHFIQNKYYSRLIRKHSQIHGKPDVVHIHFGPWTGLAITAIRDLWPDVPIVLTEHSSQVGMGRLNTKQHKLLVSIYEKVDLLTAVSEHLASKMREMVDRNVEAIPNYMDIPEVIRESTVHKHRLVSIGHLIELKRHMDIISALSLLPDPSSVRLDIYGHGPERKNLEKQIKQLGLESSVFLHGDVPKPVIYKALADADALVHASEYETFGCVFIESMSVGTPIIAAETIGIKNLIVPGVGSTYPVGDVVGLAGMISDLYDRHSCYSPEYLREHFRQNFSAEAVCQRWTQIYEKLLEKKA